MTTVGQASLYPYLFAGMELDSSGLYHTQSRYYSPTFGRFLSADAGMPPNAFSYVGNDPVNAIDPSGMTAEFVSGATGMSPPPDGARGVADAQPESGGLGGAVLAFTTSSNGTANTYEPIQDGQGSAIGLVNSSNVSPCGGGGNGDTVRANSLGHIPFYDRPGWGYNYCDSGNYSGKPTSLTDACCEAYDECYAKAYLSGNDVSVLHPGRDIGSAPADCDASLCACTTGQTDNPPSLDPLRADRVRGWALPIRSSQSRRLHLSGQAYVKMLLSHGTYLVWSLSTGHKS